MEEDNTIDSVIPASLEAALVLNYAYQELLSGIMNCVDVGIGHARYQREELLRVVEEASTKQPSKKRTLYNLVYPYFRDETDMPAPKNEDCRLRELQQFLPKEYPRAWKDTEKADLRKAVHDDAMRNLMAPLMNRLDLEYSKLEKVETRLPLSRNTDYDELVAQRTALKAGIASIQEEISDIRTNFTVNMVIDESIVDWLRISMSQFEGYHTSESCAAAWRNIAHPAVRDGKWTASEDKRLKELVLQYKERQWAQIAIELGTGRSPFMCLQRYRSVLCKTRSEHWTSEEDERLIEAVQSERTPGGVIPWMLVAAKVGKRSASKCINRWNERKLRYTGGPWRTEEDVLLAEAANMYGLAEGVQWLSTLPASRNPHAALWMRISGYVMTRTPIQCKHRWNHSLDPRLKFGQWTRQEDTCIARWLHEHGPSGWTDLAALLPGRTANMVIQRARRLQRCRPDLLELQRESARTENEGDATSQALPEDVFSSNTKIVRSAVYQRRPEVIAGLMMVQMSDRLARETPHMDRQQLKSVLLNNLQRQMGYVPAQLNSVMKTKVLDAAFQPTSGNGDLKSRAAACMSELGVALKSKGSLLSSHAGRRRRPVRRQVGVDDRGNQGDPSDDRSKANELGLAADVVCRDRRAAAKARPRRAAAARSRAAAARSRAAVSTTTDDDDDDDDDDSQESQSSAVSVDAAASRSMMTRSRAAAAASTAAAAASRAGPSPARTAGTAAAAAAATAVQSGSRAKAAASVPADDALQLSDTDESHSTHCSDSPQTSPAAAADGPRRLATATAAVVDTKAEKMLSVAVQAAISAAKSRSDCSVTRPATTVTGTAAVAASERTSAARKRSDPSVLPTDVIAKKGRLELETEEAQVDARIAEQILAISKAGATASVQSLTMEHDGNDVSTTAAQVCLQMMGMSRETALARLQNVNACQENLKQFPPAQAHRMLASAHCIKQLLAQASVDFTGQTHSPSPQPVSFAMRPAKTVREQLALRRSGIDPSLATLMAAQRPCTVVILPTPQSGIELLQPWATPATIDAAGHGAAPSPSSYPANLPAIVLSSPAAANGTAADNSSTARAAFSVTREPEPSVNGNSKNQTARLSSSARDRGDGAALAPPLHALPIVPQHAPLPIMPPQSSTVAGYRTLISRLPQLEACCDSAGRRKLEEMEKNIAVARHSSAYETLQARLESLFLWPAILSGVTPTNSPQISPTASTTSGEAKHGRAEP